MINKIENKEHVIPQSTIYGTLKFIKENKYELLSDGKKSKTIKGTFLVVETNSEEELTIEIDTKHL